MLILTVSEVKGDNMKSLIAYYSRTDITRKLAEDIAETLGADIEEITTTEKYTGKIGYARAGKHAISEKIVETGKQKHDPANYDVVYLGTPVWAGKSSTPLISYIKNNEGRFREVRFFATAGSSGFDSTFKQLEDYAKTPQKTLALTTKEVKKETYKDKLDEFVK